MSEHDEVHDRLTRVESGVTRARDELIITHTGDATTLLPSIDSGLYQVTT